MKRRLYFLSPDLNSARKIHDELLLARVPEKDMHVITGEEDRLGDLPLANLLQRTDLVHAMQLGGTIGGLLAAVLAALGIFLDWVTPGLEGLTVLSTALAGAFIGMVSASMVGINIPNTRLSRFHQAVASGKYLFIVDIPVQQVDSISKRVSSQHPEAEMRGIDPTIPAFP